VPEREGKGEGVFGLVWLVGWFQFRVGPGWAATLFFLSAFLFYFSIS
jgi:hypothetical protein